MGPIEKRRGSRDSSETLRFRSSANRSTTRTVAPGNSRASSLHRVSGSRVARLLILAVALGALGALSTQGAQAQGTPHSVQKTCGYTGGPACPAPMAQVTPWVWGGQFSGQVNVPPGLEGFGEIDAWWAAYLASDDPQHIGTGTTGGACSTVDTGQTEVSGQPQYGIDGLEQENIWDPVSYQSMVYQNAETAYPYAPACSLIYNSSGRVYEQRTVKCPSGTKSNTNTNPITCELVSNETIPPKQECPCKNKTVKDDSVDVSDGNNHVSESDYQGVGTDALSLGRTYNSVASYGYGGGGKPPAMTILGQGWSGDYFQYLTPVTGNGVSGTTVYAYRPDGTVLAFNLYNGVYSPDGDVGDSLVQETNGNWEYQTADDTIETYNSGGQLVSIARRGRAPVTVNYSAGAQPGNPPTSVSDAFGHTLQFSYLIDATDTQRLASVTDPSGSTIQYAYSSSGNLTSVTYQDSKTRAYTYGSNYSVMLLSITDESAVVYRSWTYSSFGLYTATSQRAGGVGAYTYSYSLGGASGSATVVDPLGQSRTYDQQLVFGSYHPTSSSGVCPGCGEDKSRVYDADGNITSRTDFNNNTTTYVYNATTNLETSRTEGYGTPQARTITTQWDANWSQPDLITEPNRTTAYTYDSMGNVLTKTITDTTVTPNVSRTWTYTYDSYGRMLTAQGPRTDVNSTTTYTYYTCTTGNQCGELQTVTDPVGNVTTYNTYNAHGQPLTITDPNGVVTTLTYDARLRLTSHQVGSETTTFSYYPTGLLKQVTLPDSSYILYTYDNAHRLTEISDGAGNSIQYTLDAMGNRTATKTYDPSSTLHATHTRVYNALNELYQDINAANTSAVTTTYAYDSNANQTAIDAPLSRNTANAYDPLNRLDQITDPNSGVTKFTYDAEDDLTSVKDPRTLTTSYSYNGFGDVIQLVSPDTGTSTSTYDSGGNLSVATDARASTANYSYDAANRVTSIVYENNQGQPDQTLTFGYDSGTNGKGRLTSAGDGNETLSWTYDFRGRVVGKGLTVGMSVESVGYAYTNGDLTAMVTPSGQAIAYGYNSNRQITSITVNGTTVLNSVTYEPFGGVNGWTWGDGTTVTRTFNGDGLVSQIVTAGVTLGYSFDNANRISGITDSSNSALTWSYGYDLLDRLTSASTSAITDGWTYDANGNQLTQTGTTSITYSVNSANNQLTSASGGLTRTYSYDAAGNTLSYGGPSFTYNNRGRMMSTSASSTDYLYNALGQLIEKSGTLGTTVLMYDESGHVIGEYDGSGNLIEETVWLGDIPVATLQPNGSGGINIFYIHSDHLNAPRKIAQPMTDTLVWRWDTDPFGTAAPNQNPSGLGTFSYNLRFPGQYYQAETGLNYNTARDYDPIAGRYLESDALGLIGGSYATYVYVNNNPASKIDPRGLYACTYSISAHTMYCAPDVPEDPGFYSQNYVSGNNQSSSCPDCQNNPDRTNVSDHGPIPVGNYRIGPITKPGGSRRRLTPDTPNGRTNLELHGCRYPEKCSEGCIGATSTPDRNLLNEDLSLEEGNNWLTVVP
jgi:RHS repeat-associated protein